MNLSMKTAFLVAITSAWRVGELGALMADPPYTIFFKDKSFFSSTISKLFTQGYLRFSYQSIIYLLVFYPKLHQSKQEAVLQTLGVMGALGYYQDRTRPLWHSQRLVVPWWPELKEFQWLFKGFLSGFLFAYSPVMWLLTYHAPLRLLLIPWDHAPCVWHC